MEEYEANDELSPNIEVEVRCIFNEQEFTFHEYLNRYMRPRENERVSVLINQECLTESRIGESGEEASAVWLLLLVSIIIGAAILIWTE